MAVAFKYIFQSVETLEYITETGTSSNISDAKLFSTVDFNSLPVGKWTQVPVWHVTQP